MKVTFEGHFSLGCHLHVHFRYPWHALASHGLPEIAELLVLACSQWRRTVQGTPSLAASWNKMPMRAATVVQQLCKSCRTCFMFNCMFYFTCDRSLSPSFAETNSITACCWNNSKLLAISSQHSIGLLLSPTRLLHLCTGLFLPRGRWFGHLHDTVSTV